MQLRVGQLFAAGQAPDRDQAVGVAGDEGAEEEAEPKPMMPSGIPGGLMSIGRE